MSAFPDEMEARYGLVAKVAGPDAVSAAFKRRDADGLRLTECDDSGISTRRDSQNHIPGIGIISITSTVAPGMVRCGLLPKRVAAASCDSACTME